MFNHYNRVRANFAAMLQEQDNNTENWSEPLTHDNFKATTDKYSIGAKLHADSIPLSLVLAAQTLFTLSA